MDTQQDDIASPFLVFQDRWEEPPEDEPAHDQAGSAPTDGNNAENMDLIDVADPAPELTFTSSEDWRPSRRDMTHIEGRRYSQFILHDIQSELHEGDTLIFVDFPTPSKPAESVDCFFYAWNSVQFRMHSRKLLDTGSSKFAEMLSPTYQFRIRRRRKLVNRLPEGVKYVLDLTPPSEGDELVFQMTEVSLTPGIINWWTAYDKHGIDDFIVSGHDDICSCWRDRKPDQADDLDIAIEKAPATEASRDQTQGKDLAMDRATEWAISQSLRETVPQNARPRQRAYASTKDLAARVLEKISKGDFTSEPGPAYRQIPDYCPVRHRVNILRLMCLIAGKQVLVDSAPRVWTLVAVAKILDCTSVLRDLVLQWIMSPNNTVFLEVLPEESLQIGVALKLDQITRSAFRILVNELALEEAAEPNGTPKAAAYTVFGRKRHDPGDDLNNLIQHAARAMVERVSLPVNQLVSETIFDDLQIAEWLRLQNLIDMLSGCPDDMIFQRAKDSALALARSLKNTWKNHVVYNLLRKPLHADLLTNADDHRATYVDVRHFNRLEVVYNQFNNVQKALCSFMYEAVGNRWTSIACIFSDASIHPSFNRLTSDLWVILKELHRQYPELARDPAWKALLNLPHNASAVLGAEPYVDSVFSNAKHAFDPRAFEAPLQDFLRPFYRECIRADFEIKMNLTPHLLLNLHHNELKFLPLWAGGNDDGTGGVFEHSLPPAAYGPAGPGPAYHTGVTIPSDASSTAGSVSSVLRQLRLEGGSTIGPGSVDVQDGISTVFNPNKVVADDQSIRTESFTDGESVYGNARYAVPVDGQSVADAIGAVVLDSTPDQSDAGTSVNLETDDDMDEVMTEIGPDESRSREESPEYVATSSGTQPKLTSGGKPPSTATSTEGASCSSLLDDDDDLVMV
ncbi:hypothetical protein CT0861_07744 [Colletotrichum tofieldiae]|uniref:Uncharacterized protein n=1 Tax=Colletotrichum tofieldiae TaxID=708197 RepID=A0A166USU9_9PEZI|nr:hypothetical protein CT0861_07744 [Colletotrichum tofieldiae]GKT92898.1 hypothetical protein Ct61P_10748 [Colletotrichum tofieldiae]